jgi:Protein of unknown function (DUF4058)
MASPFPGMDPYLEGPDAWLDFHSRFINAWCEGIADGVPHDYEANLGERVYLVEVDPESRKPIYPDVAVTERGERRPTTASTASATLEPVTLPLEIIEGPKEAYIEVLHRPDRSLVAVLELLSPANKENPGRTEYLSKRNALLRQNVHLVELDLLLGGKRVPSPKPLPVGDCYYLESRAEKRFDCDVYHWKLADPLPRLPVPLRPPDVDVIVDLAQVFTTAYERGRFGRRLRYDQPCSAPLSEEQRAWASQVASKVVRV